MSDSYVEPDKKEYWSNIVNLNQKVDEERLFHLLSVSNLVSCDQNKVHPKQSPDYRYWPTDKPFSFSFVGVGAYLNAGDDDIVFQIYTDRMLYVRRPATLSERICNFQREGIEEQPYVIRVAKWHLGFCSVTGSVLTTKVAFERYQGSLLYCRFDVPDTLRFFKQSISPSL